MGSPFETGNIHAIEVTKLDRKGIELYIPIGKGNKDDCWCSTLKLYMNKEDAIKAGIPQQVFKLDDIHYKEFNGKNLDPLFKLIEKEIKTKLTFSITF